LTTATSLDGSESSDTHTHMLLPKWACGRLNSIYRPSPHETRKAKLPSTLPVGVEPVLRSSLGGEGMAPLNAPGFHWNNEMGLRIQSRSWADCHKFINEHDDELVREVLKYFNSSLLRELVCNSQVYTDSLMFLALRMIHRHPLSLTATLEIFWQLTAPSSVPKT